MIQLHHVNDFSPRNQKAMKNTKNALLMNMFIFSFFFFVSCTTDSEFFTDAILETPEEIIDENSGSEETEPEVETVIDYQNGILTFAEDKVITLDLEKGASSYTGKSFALKSIIGFYSSMITPRAIFAESVDDFIQNIWVHQRPRLWMLNTSNPACSNCVWRSSELKSGSLQRRRRFWPVLCTTFSMR